MYDHIAQAIDTQVRVKVRLALHRPVLEFTFTLQWQPGTVVLWDNRITAHSAIADFDQIGGRRNGARITPQAEWAIPANANLVVPDGPVEDNARTYRSIL